MSARTEAKEAVETFIEEVVYPERLRLRDELGVKHYTKAFNAVANELILVSEIGREYLRLLSAYWNAPFEPVPANEYSGKHVSAFKVNRALNAQWENA